MRKYETMFLFESNYAAKNWEKVIDTIGGICSKHGGQVISSKKWDERRLAYEINGHKRGTYILTHLMVPTQKITLLRRDYSLEDHILRFMFLKLNENQEVVEKDDKNSADQPVSDDDDNSKNESEVKETGNEVSATEDSKDEE